VEQGRHLDPIAAGGGRHLAQGVGFPCDTREAVLDQTHLRDQAGHSLPSMARRRDHERRRFGEASERSVERRPIVDDPDVGARRPIRFGIRRR
jgi:hypothetical protein